MILRKSPLNSTMSEMRKITRSVSPWEANPVYLSSLLALCLNSSQFLFIKRNIASLLRDICRRLLQNDHNRRPALHVALRADLFHKRLHLRDATCAGRHHYADTVGASSFPEDFLDIHALLFCYYSDAAHDTGLIRCHCDAYVEGADVVGVECEVLVSHRERTRSCDTVCYAEQITHHRIRCRIAARTGTRVGRRSHILR
mmetsp:Transcript_48062/g.65442  ORF Transcript_48062/g.65442 Transcript_48062/m.65442 type:complete len:200 (+) Transcript_48062:79-678(+)